MGKLGIGSLDVPWLVLTGICVVELMLALLLLAEIAIMLEEVDNVALVLTTDEVLAIGIGGVLPILVGPLLVDKPPDTAGEVAEDEVL